MKTTHLASCGSARSRIRRGPRGTQASSAAPPAARARGAWRWARARPRFWFSMEQSPADARAAPSASEPNDTVMDIHASPKPKRPRESAQGNMVSQIATTNAPLWPESQSETTVMLSRAHVPTQYLIRSSHYWGSPLYYEGRRH
eukprot:scaffold23281_cov120-Isochrysis_galbana.AAC.8